MSRIVSRTLLESILIAFCILVIGFLGLRTKEAIEAHSSAISSCMESEKSIGASSDEAKDICNKRNPMKPPSFY
jgi:hypothetical protein